MLDYLDWSDDMESGITGWGSSAGGVLSSTGAVAYRGVNSLRADINLAGSGGVTISKTFPMTGKGLHGKSVRVRAMVRTSNIGSGFAINGAAVTAINTWTPMVTTVTANASTGAVTAAVNVTVTGPFVGVVWVDWVRLELVHTEVVVTQPAALAFPFSPDGVIEVQETWGFITDVMTSYNAREGRSGKRQTPRLSLSFKATEIGSMAFQRLQTLLAANSGSRWAVPWWPNAQLTTAITGTPATGEVLTVPNADAMYVVGQSAYIWKDELTYDLIPITAVAGNQITVTGTGTFTHVAGRVYLLPSRTCVSQPTSVDAGPAPAGSAQIVMEGVDDTTSAFTQAWAGAMYRSKILLDYPYFDGAQPAVAYQRPILKVDNGARAYITLPTDLPLGERSMKWICQSQAEIGEMLSFFLNVKGRRDSFWAVDRSEAMTTQNESLVGGTHVYINDVGFTERQFPHLVRRHIALPHADGTITPALVTASAKTAGKSRVLLSLNFADVPISVWNNAVNISVVSEPTARSGRALRITDAYRIFYPNLRYLVPFDPDVLYGVTIRARIVQANTDASLEVFYAGFRNVTASYAIDATNRYITASGIMLTPAQGWVTRTGFLRGRAGYIVNSTNPLLPSGTGNPNTAYISPMTLVNYNTPSGQITELDYMEIAEYQPGEDLTISVPLTKAVAVNQPVHQIIHSRLTEDELVLQHIADGVAVASMGMKELPVEE